MLGRRRSARLGLYGEGRRVWKGRGDRWNGQLGEGSR